MLEDGEAAQLVKCDDAVHAAKKILSCRPGFQPDALPSKGGPKYFGVGDTDQEENRVNSQLDKYATVLFSNKVRKLSNLGHAEWIPSLGVAKVIRQGKFMQQMGHHNGKYFVLDSEEAMFLLDIGDIELTLNGVPLTLQEAYAIVFNNEKSCCTLNEYQVFSHLLKRGFVVQRFQNKETEDHAVKRNLVQDENHPQSPKKIKTDITTSPYTFSQARKVECGQRGWNLPKNRSTSTVSETLKSLMHLNATAMFPNLAVKTLNYLPKPSQSLLPPNTDVDEFHIEEIWFQRIKRDSDDANATPMFSYPMKIDRNKIARESKTWSDYKDLIKMNEKSNKEKYIQLTEKMNSGKIKPLLQTSNATSLRNVFETIKLSKEVSSKNWNNNQEPKKFFIKYNAYKLNPSKPFKKTNPGLPFCSVVVTETQGNIPDFKSIMDINSQANGVPVKYGVVDFGQVSFFAFDDANLPTILHDDD